MLVKIFRSYKILFGFFCILTIQSKYEYSPKVKGLETELKATKKQEEENGIAKKVSDYIVDIVCEESKNGNYIVDPLDVKGVISESEFIRYKAEIIEEINKNYKVA